MTSLRDIQQTAGAEPMPYGPPPAEGGVEIVATFGEYEAEYGAIRSRVGIMHRPQRAILRFTGADRQDFLHRMLTQDINGMKGGETRRGFQLNGKGRIVADALIHHGDADTWLEVDVLDIDALHTLLDARLFAEDVAIEKVTDAWEAFSLHGPAAQALLQAVADEGQDAAAPANMPGTHHVLSLAAQKATVYRRDLCGVPGLHLLVPADHAAELYTKLLDAAGFEPGAAKDAALAERRRGTLRGRPIGWLAFNTTRIEAGTPLFHVDFGTDSLPGETGLLDEVVSFTKGCYLGQEIVARMKNLGHPKRLTVGVRFAGDDLPVAGTQLFDATDKTRAVGGITSSTPSPLLGHAPIAFAVVKWGGHESGTKVLAAAEGRFLEGEIGPLNFLEGD